MLLSILNTEGPFAKGAAVIHEKGGGKEVGECSPNVCCTGLGLFIIIKFDIAPAPG